jgi:hypothetical protein
VRRSDWLFALVFELLCTYHLIAGARGMLLYVLL